MRFRATHVALRNIMQHKLKLRTTKITKFETEEYDIGDGHKIIKNFVDDQYSSYEIVPNPSWYNLVYGYKMMTFQILKDSDSIEKILEKTEEKQNELFISDEPDLNKITLDQCVCDWSSMYGFVHVLTDQMPRMGWRHMSYMDGYSNEYINIPNAKRHLKKHPWVKDVTIEEVPYYNRSKECTKSLEFYLRVPAEELYRVQKLKPRLLTDCFKPQFRGDTDLLNISQFLKDRKNGY